MQMFKLLMSPTVAQIYKREYKIIDMDDYTRNGFSSTPFGNPTADGGFKH